MFGCPRNRVNSKVEPSGFKVKPPVFKVEPSGFKVKPPGFKVEP
jgi:hypothetical protein